VEPLRAHMARAATMAGCPSKSDVGVGETVTKHTSFREQPQLKAARVGPVRGAAMGHRLQAREHMQYIRDLAAEIRPYIRPRPIIACSAECV